MTSTNKELTNDTYVKIVDAYINAGAVEISSSNENHPRLYWLIAMGMYDTLRIIGVNI